MISALTHCCDPQVGEAAIREVAAYLMDHDHRANVPATVLVEATHSIFHVADMAQRFVKESSNQDGGQGLERAVPSKLGSLQQYTEHLCDSSEVGASRFNKQNVHRIGILDLRLLNTDRHAGVS